MYLRSRKSACTEEKKKKKTDLTFCVPITSSFIIIRHFRFKENRNQVAIMRYDVMLGDIKMQLWKIKSQIWESKLLFCYFAV